MFERSILAYLNNRNPGTDVDKQTWQLQGQVAFKNDMKKRYVHSGSYPEVHWK